MNTASILSTLTVTGSFTDIIMLCNKLTINMTSFTTIENMMHSAFELERVMLFCLFDYQDTGTPKTQSTKPLIFFLVTRSTTYSLLPKETIFQVTFSLLIGSNFNSRLLVSNKYIHHFTMHLREYSQFYAQLMLVISDLECFTR